MWNSDDSRRMARVTAEEFMILWEAKCEADRKAVRKERREVRNRIKLQKKKWKLTQAKLLAARSEKIRSQRRARKCKRKKTKNAKLQHWLKFRAFKYNVSCSAGKMKEVLLFRPVYCRSWSLQCIFDISFKERSKKRKKWS